MVVTKQVFEYFFAAGSGLGLAFLMTFVISLWILAKRNKKAPR